MSGSRKPGSFSNSESHRELYDQKRLMLKLPYLDHPFVAEPTNLGLSPIL
jgi:hypothetical protein